jgi:glycosyltransferase involved in cell wall biosynthesis
MTLTILICVHSTNKFHDLLLDRSIQSLVNQTYNNFKTLIVLDQCWDKTKELIESSNYNLDLTILIKNKKEGLSYAKNFGLQHINTEWVGFLDGDDLYLPTKIETQINHISNNDVDFLGTHRFHIGPHDDNKTHNGDFKDVNKYITHSEIKDYLPYENMLTHGSMIIRKKCLDELGGYNNIRGMEDWDLWKRGMDKGYKFYQIPERLYKYRENTSVPR